MRRKHTILDDKRLKMISKFVKGKDVLDIAYHSNPNKNLSKFNAIGIDLSFSDNADFYKKTIIGDATKLPDYFKKESFDTIIIGEFIEHVEIPYKLLRDCHFLLRDSGRLIITTPNPLSFPFIVAEYLSLQHNFFEPEHKFVFPKRWMYRMLKYTGFNNMQCYSIGMWLPKYFDFFVLKCPKIMSLSLLYIADK